VRLFSSSSSTGEKAGSGEDRIAAAPGSGVRSPVVRPSSSTKKKNYIFEELSEGFS
jgi:hypothetical protein